MNIQQTIRTRFAPSPTGFLHIGGVRTALFAWLFARRHGGQFILRIEDTDLERSTPASIQAILDGMTWLQLDHDEGPYYQMERMDRYREVIQQLLASGYAYRCYCSKERLDGLRESQMAAKQKPRYDGFCRATGLDDASRPHVIRFKNPLEGEVTFEDQVHGFVSVSNTELDDLIIARTDGVPTYNFTVVVDDWDMKITHVIRGTDHINNTPRQINILNALGADIPVYAHVPMILGEDGKRLSKRHGAVSVLQYRDEGYLPEAVLNYLLRLGWSHGDQEIFSREEMITFFDLQHINKAAAAVNTDKLLWLNQHYLKQADSSTLEHSFSVQLDALGVDYRAGPMLSEVIAIQAERCKTLQEMAEKSRYFFEEYDAFDEKAAKKNLKPAIKPVLESIWAQLSDLAEWQPEPIHQVIIKTAEASELKLGKVAQPVRVAATGGAVSPPLDMTLFLIGRDSMLNRLKKAIDRCDVDA